MSNMSNVKEFVKVKQGRRHRGRGAAAPQKIGTRAAPPPKRKNTERRRKMTKVCDPPNQNLVPTPLLSVQQHIVFVIGSHEQMGKTLPPPHWCSPPTPSHSRPIWPPAAARISGRIWWSNSSSGLQAMDISSSASSVHMLFANIWPGLFFMMCKCWYM